MTFMIHDTRSQTALDIKFEVAFVMTMVDEAITMASIAMKILIYNRWLYEENEGVLMKWV
jgi:hypothetical protein